MKDTLLLLVRHGQTDWNIQKRMQGQTDVPLNSEGKKQAGKIAEQLKQYPIDVLYSSPQVRALSTAQAIHHDHAAIPIVTHEALKERSFGKFEGKLLEEILRAHPEFLFEESWNYPMLQIPQGERLIDVYNRGKKFLSNVLISNEGKTIAIVSHGITIHCLICILLDIPLSHGGHFSLGNTSITLMKKSGIGAAELHTINNTFHLDHDKESTILRSGI